MPPQGGWQPQQPGGQPPYSGPPGGHPQYAGQQPPGFPQGQWPPQQSHDRQKGNSTKWLLVAIAVLLVVGVSIGATLLFTRDGGNDPSNSPTSGDSSDIASANDTGPVAIIAEEPTCKALTGINRSVAGVEANGWGEQRKSLGPASEWTSEQRNQVQSVATAIRNASDQMVPLAKQTPHRVIRELYEQYIAYGRAYADSINSYVPANNILADVNVSIGNVLLGVCSAIEYGSANRSVAVSAVAGPTEVAAVGDPSSPDRFLTTANPTCSEWIQRERDFIADTAEWEKIDPEAPASQWSPEQRAIQDSALTTFTTLADASEAAGRDSGNAVFEDFATLAAQYMRAYVAAGQNYIGADSWLSYTGLRLSNAVSGACQAAET